MRTAPAPLLRLAGLVRNTGIKVVLTGEGADEIFGGYNIFARTRCGASGRASRIRHGARTCCRSLYGYIAARREGRSVLARVLPNGLENTATRTTRTASAGRTRRRSNASSRRICARSCRATKSCSPSWRPIWSPTARRWHPLCRAQYLEMTLFMSCYLLNSQGDRMMMGHSVEGRVPFLDHRLIELAARIPPKFKLRGLDREVHPEAELRPTSFRPPSRTDRSSRTGRRSPPASRAVRRTWGASCCSEKRSSRTGSSMWTLCSGCCRRRAPPAQRLASATRWRWPQSRRCSSCTISS